MTNNIKHLFTSSVLLSIILTACSDPGSAGYDNSTDGTSEVASVPEKLTTLDLSEAADGTALSEFGFTSGLDSGGNDAFIINNNVIELNTENGWFNFTTSAFEISRNDNGGIRAEWEIKYPETIAENDRELAKFYFTLLSSSGTDTYTFLFKPYLRTGETSYNIEISNSSGSLLQSRTRDTDTDFTSNGSSAAWINFKLELASSGEIRLLIDDVEFMNLTDSAHTDFEKVKFTYRTGEDTRAYNIQIRNISVLPLN